ncbi:methylase [bacterium]|nr:methylase [bacterium]MBP5592404.1 methylase [bacterium]
MAKTAINRKKAAKEFADFWKNKGDERQETARFWIGLLCDVLGMENPAKRIEFEKKVQLKHTSFIDAYIPETKVLIEQKSSDVDLRKEAKQSDGAMLTPYRQAKRYADEMPNSLRPNWIVVCNFQEFLIYDMEKPHDEPVQVMLKDLPDKFECLQFMVDTKKTSVSLEEQVSLKAGELVGKLYDALIKEYINPDENSFRSLNILCVRIVFCLYAEDAGLFETRTSFEDYIKSFNLPDLRLGIINLFKALDTKPENRDKYDLKLKAFPYVNGGLFAAEDIEVPNFSDEIVNIIVNHCAPFDWSEISPTIFGAVFESTLNPETRRKGGMHYTSIANIHKVIDPLFLDDLWKEFYEITGKKCHSKLEGLSQSDWGVCQNKKATHSTAASGTSPNLGEELRLTAKQRSRLEQFRNKIANLKFLDPACGSGNFLTETYIALRRLENEILKIIHGNQQLLGSDFSPIKVKISQFYGIEINDFAVTVAKTALWIAESQMMKETEEIVDEDLNFLPLSTSATIIEGNALRMDWRYLCEEDKIPTIKAKKTNLIYEVHEREEKYEAINLITDEINIGKPQQKKTENHYDYIMGNPPFVGASMMTAQQKKDATDIFGKIHFANSIDYVGAWYHKAAELIIGKSTKAAFVSTNSITQGEQVFPLWNKLLKKGINIDFAWQTFRWDSESTRKAHVHCVIIGFSYRSDGRLPVKTRHSEHREESQRCFADAQHDKKRIFTLDGKVIEAKNINPYLIDTPDVLIESQAKPLCDVPMMTMGNKPSDNGNFIFSEEERDKFVKNFPEDARFLRRYVGAKDFLNNNEIRYCLWLKNVAPSEYIHNKEIMRRLDAIKAFREKSTAEPTRKLAVTPWKFFSTPHTDKSYLIVPSTSSERRTYIPIGFMTSEIIAANSCNIIPNATLYHFGVLTSNVHNAWMRLVGGRLKSDYRYSGAMVYNTFPWCSPTDAQKAKIEQTAQAILDARSKYPEVTLAELYGEHMYLFPELVKAHKENDKAVMAAYSFDPKMSEADMVAELFKMYEKLTK